MERGQGKPSVSPVDLSRANQLDSIIFAAACTWRKYLDPCALGGVPSDRIRGPRKSEAFVGKGERTGAVFGFAQRAETDEAQVLATRWWGSYRGSLLPLETRISPEATSCPGR